MSMFCFQCQEAAMGKGCTIRGVCGKTEETAKLQDLLLYTVKSVALFSRELRKVEKVEKKVDYYLINSLFMTITNANFDNERIGKEILKGLKLRDELWQISLDSNIKIGDEFKPYLKSINELDTKEKMVDFASCIGVERSKDEDIKSLREMIIYGLKGISAYAEHAYNLGHENEEIFKFIENTIIEVDKDENGIDKLVSFTMETGKYGVEAMSLLDKANTERYGHPQITKVNIGVRNNPGILISGHDLKDMEQLLEQTKDLGIDIYTHSEMLPAHYYPAFKDYPNFAGNYGGSWWHQTKEFEKFNGPILFTSNCIVPPRASSLSYRKRIFTTNSAGLDGCIHIEKDENGSKNFSKIIEVAKKCEGPEEIEKGEIIGGFAHNQVFALADKVVEAVKSGAIKKFVVMAGCDARMKDREYYTEFAKALPNDTVILTAGCAKYRYNKLALGDIGGIPRVLDAGQCNDSYSLALIAMKLQEIFGLDDINKLPIVYNIAWYEQKAVIVLLALLYLGVKNIHLGPTLPAFLSSNITNVLVEKFGIGTISDVEEDIKSWIG